MFEICEQIADRRYIIHKFADATAFRTWCADEGIAPVHFVTRNLAHGRPIDLVTHHNAPAQIGPVNLNVIMPPLKMGRGYNF